MGKRSCQTGTKGKRLSKDERRLKRFCRIMCKGQNISAINDETWTDFSGAVKTLQRLAWLKSVETSHAIKALEQQTKYGPAQDTLSQDTIEDKINIANQLIAQRLHWDKIEGALLRARCLCCNEDTTLRDPIRFKGAELLREIPPVLHKWKTDSAVAE